MTASATSAKSGTRTASPSKLGHVSSGLTFSRREVAEFAGCSLQAIDKAIEQRVVPKRRAKSETVIGEDGLAVMLMLAHTKLDLPVKTKQFVRQWLAESRPFAKKGEQMLELSEVLVVRVPEPVKTIVAEAAAYAADRNRFITSDPNVFGGQPIIAGTRIPVHTVAERLEAGDTLEVLAEDYPHVEPRALEVAARYARTHPRRGRPVKPWRNAAARRTSRA
jgi:uncharacterized protein (DUF433 family)